ncbi:MAG TPA: hypothetical protein VFQ61_38610, partial [Polyangiaceae bacterium]|nr:hypothetical protein [Polyangiaceae bacterium]
MMTSDGEARARELATEAERLRCLGLNIAAIAKFNDALGELGNSTARLKSWCLAHRGSARSELGDTEGAIADLDAAVELRKGEYAWALAHKGEAYRIFARGLATHTEEDHRRFSEAIENACQAFQAACVLDGHSAWTHAHLGATLTLKLWHESSWTKAELKAQKQSFDAAKAALDHALELQPTYPWALQFEALLFGIGGDELAGKDW